MFTIKLPIQNQIDITDYLRSYNSIVRFAYNRFADGMGQKEIREIIKSDNYNYNSELLDSWFTQCAIMEAKSWYSKSILSKDKKFVPIIFGGKPNLIKRINNKITNDEWRKSRLHMLSVQGETLKKGNRKFELDVLKNNQIIFKPSRKVSIPIQLPRLHKNYKFYLTTLELLAKGNRACYSIKLNNDHISISFDESMFKKESADLKDNRVLAIDLNPNSMGWSVLEFSDDKLDVVHSEIVDMSEHTKKTSSTNKRHHEVYEIGSYLVQKALQHYWDYFQEG